ncbi:MAG: sulfur carrier protein ThiS [Lentisphaerae bacterium]|nr:sulfur carrier protein ThiS [Lentisphaerota bacterium]
MKLIVNGREHEHRGEGTIAALLREIGAVKEHVAVVLNHEVIAGARRDSLRLSEKDHVEIVTFAGGG